MSVIFNRILRCVCWTVHTVGGWMVRVALRRRFRGIQEPLVAHVAFTAAEEHVGTLLPLHALVTAEDTEVEIRNTAHWEGHGGNLFLFKCKWVHTRARTRKNHHLHALTAEHMMFSNKASAHSPSSLLQKTWKKNTYKITPTHANTHTHVH